MTCIFETQIAVHEGKVALGIALKSGTGDEFMSLPALLLLTAKEARTLALGLLAKAEALDECQ